MNLKLKTIQIITSNVRIGPYLPALKPWLGYFHFHPVETGGYRIVPSHPGLENSIPHNDRREPTKFPVEPKKRYDEIEVR